jgi:hypothetical protein
MRMLDMNKARMKFIELREALGFDEADTASTWDGWDLTAGLAIIQFPSRQKKYANNPYKAVWKNFFDYFRKLHPDEGLKIVHPTLWYFYQVHKRVFPDEFETLPLWAIKRTTRESMEANEDIFGPMEWNSRWLHQLFDKMIVEIYNGEVTIDDFRTLMKQRPCQRLGREYAWFPYNELFNQAKNTYRENGRTAIFGDVMSHWRFIRMFEKHACRNEKGRFTKSRISWLDYIVGRESNLVDNLWSLDYMRRWFFDYLCEEYSIELDESKFPYESSEKELEQVILLRTNEVNKVIGASRICRFIRKGKFGPMAGVLSSNIFGIKEIVKGLWPDYEMDEVRWSRLLISEKRMCNMLLRVWKHHGYDGLRAGDAEYIYTKTGKWAHYKDSGYPMKVDAVCDELMVGVEGQGGWHYKDVQSVQQVLEEGSIVYSHKIPDCYEGEGESPLAYRQDRDRKCKRAMKRHGYTPIYIILSSESYPVKGVHGDLPSWNRKYVTTEKDKTRVGLAECFERQGRVDIGEMIRQYYEEVILEGFL